MKTMEYTKNSKETVECIAFVDYPVFEIQGKEYALVDLTDSRLVHEVDRELQKTKVDRDTFDFTLTRHGLYFIPDLNEYLDLLVTIDCELEDTFSSINSKSRYVSTNIGIRDLKLVADRGDAQVEPETVDVLC
ncbi:hypothetical protein [Limosilactobacillus mucosae]|uniref:Uncharacterized protein n=1 Tax=Limosilactobacillus mucosae TaxID=97478 RepID=A0AAJ1HRR3_LIMMU|nr:hypothetical protein [Limosilactobacillus mucosae]MDC2828470.1 hypothetical protein [Limosilactobacillus mucosae]MDC2834368.1 hypothetical protein [Limosilactobacillus mucosae]